MFIDFNQLKTADEDRLTYKYFSGGEWLESDSGMLLDVISPIDNSLVGRVQQCTEDDIDTCITNASLAKSAWASLSLEDRISVFKNVIFLLKRNKKIFIELLMRELGKLENEAEEEIEKTLAFLKNLIQEKKWEKESRIFRRGKICYLKRLPLGVILGIVPFNFPIYISATKIGPALIAGNSCVIKAPSQGAISLLHFVQLFKEAGVFEGALNVITGKGEKIGEFLITHELIDMISFTGSSSVGEFVAEKAKLVPLVLALGGKNAAIVLPDANLKKAVKEIAMGAFTFAGQRANAIKRVIIIESIADKFIKLLKNFVEVHFKRVGDPFDKRTQLGPVRSKEQTDYLKELLEDAKEKGAKIVLGGKTKKETYFQATVIDKVTPQMRIAWEEQFGPILPILRVKDIIKAVDLHNASDYGLGVSVFTKNLKKAKELAQALEAAIVQINGKTQRAPDNFPFMGQGISGVGVEGIPWSIESMTQFKATIINR